LSHATPTDRDPRPTDDHGDRNEESGEILEPCRVKDVVQVVGDEPARVYVLASARTQVILDGRQWTRVAHGDDARTPRDRRDVQPQHLRSPPSKQTTDRDEPDEREVHDNDRVGEDPIDHEKP
jgi:hypothetical protein